MRGASRFCSRLSVSLESWLARADPRLKLLYLLAVAIACLFAREPLRVGILVSVLFFLLLLCHRSCLRRWFRLVFVLAASGSVLLAHCFSPAGSTTGSLSVAASVQDRAGSQANSVSVGLGGCRKGTVLALGIVSIYALTMLLLRSSGPHQVVSALRWLLPLANRRGSPTQSLVSIMGMGLLILPALSASLASAKTAMSVRGGRIAGLSFRQGLSNLVVLSRFAVRRLYIPSADILGRLSVRGYVVGTERPKPVGGTLTPAAFAAFAVITSSTLALLLG